MATVGVKGLITHFAKIVEYEGHMMIIKRIVIVAEDMRLPISKAKATDVLCSACVSLISAASWWNSLVLE